MSEALEVRPGELLAEQAGVTPEQVQVVARTVARGATWDELGMFFSIARMYDLDPFAREIWCICELNADGSRRTKDGEPKPATITVSRDGFLKIANRNEAYDGMLSDVVREKDTFTVKRTSENLHGILEEHSYGTDRGPVIGAYAIVFRKDRSQPSYFYAPWSEYGAPNIGSSFSPWKKYPSAMIKKVAEAMCLKQAFSVSGVVAEEELHAGRAIEEGAPSSVERRPLITPGIGQARVAGYQEPTFAESDEPVEAEAEEEPGLPDERTDEQRAADEQIAFGEEGS